MKILRQFAVILAIWLIGEMINRFLKIPIPGSVIGMLILLGLLQLRVIKEESLKEMSDFLLGNLAFFFIPSAAAIMIYFGDIKESLLKIVVITIGTTVFVMAVTGLTVQWLIKRRRK